MTSCRNQTSLCIEYISGFSQLYYFVYLSLPPSTEKTNSNPIVTTATWSIPILILISLCRDENHLTPLLLAARLDRCQTITMLLDYGAKIGGVSKNKVKQTFVVIIATFSKFTDISSHPLQSHAMWCTAIWWWEHVLFFPGCALKKVVLHFFKYLKCYFHRNPFNSLCKVL